MAYAHVTAGTVDQIGQSPALHFDGDRWWDLRPLDPAMLAMFGWLPLVEAARPADTATTTWTRGDTVGASAVTVTWTERAKTADELATDTQNTNRDTLAAQAAAALTRLNAIVTGANTIINDATMTTAELATYHRQTAAAVQDMARYQRAIIRLLRSLLGHPDALDIVDA